MTPGRNSYGDADQVAAFTRRYTNAGSYDTTTNPTLATVEGWIDSVSATLNVILSGSGFTIPITQEDAARDCAGIVTGAVADLCHAANSAGRFFTERALERGVSPLRVLRQEMADWVDAQADGLEMLGATRTQTSAGGIAFRDTDEAGDETFPIFQRSGFGNTFEDSDQ